LTRPFDKHLDSDELDRLVSLQEPSVSGSAQLSEPALREAQRHVESCQDCSRKVQRHKFVQSEMSRMRAPNPSLPTPECREDAEWCEVAAGLMPEADTRELMKHAAQCGHCGTLLKNAAEALVDEATPSEDALLMSLQSARPEWRKNMAATLRDSMRGRKPELSWWKTIFAWPTPAYAFAGIIAVALVAWIGVRTLYPPSAEQLLAQAYSEHRTLEVRIPGARYARMQAERGNAQSDFDKPPSLLKAKDLIGEALTKNPNDPKWLQARARAELLDGNYDDAIKSLQRSLEFQPDSPTVLTDLGSAYYERARSADRPIDFGNAIESFGKALAREPTNPIALFNRALACEQMFLYTQAIDDWQHYLRLDPNGDWSAEARQHLQAIQEKRDQHSRNLAEPLLTPGQIAHASSSDLETLDDRAEDYLDRSIEEWLPAVFSADTNTRVTDLAAVKLLSTLLISKHGDYWLSELIENSNSVSFAEGISSLSEAVTANAAGDPDEALRSAKRSQRSFQRANNEAGKLRAEAEIVYALHRKYLLDSCQQQIAKTRRSLPNRFPWIQVQLDLEQYACGTGNSQNLNEVASTAQRAHYPTLYLRALAFCASSETDTGAAEKGWSWDAKGLVSFWSGNYRSLRAQHFYDDMSISAQNRGQWWLAVALERDAVAAIAASPNRSGEVLERIKLARSASEVGLWQEASDQYRTALSAFSTSLPDDSTKALRATAEIGLAEVALGQKNIEASVEHLRYAAENIPSSFHNAETWISLYSISAKLRGISGDQQGARRNCEAAVLVAEDDLRQVSSESDEVRWLRTGADCYRILVQQKLGEGDAVSALEIWDWYRSAASRTKEPWVPLKSFSILDRPTPLPTLRDVETLLPSMDHETAIVYARLGEHIQVWVFDNRGIYQQTLPAASSLPADAARFGRLCADRQSDPEELGRELYRVLFQPILPHLDAARTLIIEADDDFSPIPFAALVAPDDSYLADHFTIAYLPASGYRHVLRPYQPISPQSFAVVFGPPATSDLVHAGYAPLPDAESEAQYVAAQFSSSSLTSGREATFDRLASVLPLAEIFHFAGHTRLQPGHSGLLLADDPNSNSDRAIFSADALEAHVPTRLRLAVLSACSTDPANDPELSPSENLTKAFLRAGVPRVVATRWRVDSTATSILMRVFYQELLSGASVPAALKASVQSLRHSAQYRHPYFWAGLESFGGAA
jgi:CHAT domain-containing protein/cytochrome c-type biogenesis protein CcmH/NrfG